MSDIDCQVIVCKHQEWDLDEFFSFFVELGEFEGGGLKRISLCENCFVSIKGVVLQDVINEAATAAARIPNVTGPHIRRAK